MTTFNCDLPADVKRRMERGETAIRAFRQHHHMPLPDLALRAGLNCDALAAAESGRQPLQGAELKQVADALAIPVTLLKPSTVAKLLDEVKEAGSGNPGAAALGVLQKSW
jgi:transcriptional regulator with XRE-family HTH domain